MKRKVLITGGAGFIGSHLAHELRANGYQVRVLDNFAAQVHGDSWKAQKVLGSEIEIQRGDVRSEEDLRRAMDGVSVIYHFAASVGVGQSMYEVKSYVDNNNLGTANLLQLLIHRPVERLIVASSMSLYGEGLYQTPDGQIVSNARRDMERLKSHDWEMRSADGQSLTPIPTPESKSPDLASIYALSKYDQERMCLLVGQAYRIPTVALRFFNVYGRGQSLNNPYTGVMAIFGARLLNNSAPIVFEDGHQMRDFVHVSDVVRACRLALEVPRAEGLSINIASGSHFTVKDIATRMAAALGKEHIEPQLTQQYRVGDIRHCFADISLAKKVLGFRPSVNLADGLGDLAEWLSGQHAVDLTQRAHQELQSKGLAV